VEGPVSSTSEQSSLDHVRASLDTRYASEREDDPETGTPLLGIGIAFGAFVPTFLLIVMGLPYLLAPVAVPVAVAPDPATLSLLSTAVMDPSSRSDSSNRAAASLSELVETRAVSGSWASPDRARATRPGDDEAKPARIPSPDAISWTRAAAFADDQAAARLARSLRGQGYRVDLRREDGATLPWVVWTGKPPTPLRPAR
jgi:hypothetical protein